MPVLTYDKLNPGVPFFDRLAFRTKELPLAINYLRQHCRWAGARRGHPMVGQGTAYKWLVIVVAPRRPALEFLAQQPWLLNAAEVALDFTSSDRAGLGRVRELLLRHFDQPRYRGEPGEVGRTVYWRKKEKGRPSFARQFVLYDDRARKMTGEVH